MFQQRRRRRCNDFDSNNPILSTACAGTCVPGVFGLCRHPHSKKGIYLRRRFQRRLRIYLRCRRFAFSRKSPSGPGLFEDFFHWYVFKVSSFPRVKGVVLEGGSDVSCSHNNTSSSRRRDDVRKRATAKESNIIRCFDAMPTKSKRRRGRRRFCFCRVRRM